VAALGVAPADNAAGTHGHPGRANEKVGDIRGWFLLEILGSNTRAGPRPTSILEAVPIDTDPRTVLAAE
jgi:hypothetical protein